MDSRAAASHNLTAQGHKLLKNGDADGALRLLERAVGINPSDGPAYYYLAEAWLAKGNLPMAARFNKLAVTYLKNESNWTMRAKDQTMRINSRQSPPLTMEEPLNPIKSHGKIVSDFTPLLTLGNLLHNLFDTA